MACIRHDRRHGRLVIDFYDQDKRIRLKVLPKNATMKEAKAVKRDIENQVEEKTFISKVKMPTFPEVAESWLRYKEPNVRESTFIQYEGHIRNHLIPFLGSVKVVDIDFGAVEKFMAQKTDDGISPATLKKSVTTLGAILKYAVRKRYIKSNPVREVEKPRGKSKPKEEMDFLRPHEIRALIDVTRDQKYKALFMMAVMSGMRQGELLGLKWGDIDWINSQIRVRRTFNYGQFFEPKSRTSRRSIDMAPALAHELRVWRMESAHKKLDDLVFPNREGKPLDYHNLVNRHFLPALRRAGLRKIRFHALRHSFGALLIDQGEHPKYIQVQMGHSVYKCDYGCLWSPDAHGEHGDVDEAPEGDFRRENGC